MLARLGSPFPLQDLAVGSRLLWHLPGFLRRPLTTDEARAILRRRLERRETDFLARAREGVYGYDPSPYRLLLSLAGCEYGDLQRLVHREGLEGALRALYRHGVYLTVDEFKGRRPAVRGSSTVGVDPLLLRNPSVVGHVSAQTGGSRGAATVVPANLAFIRDTAVNLRLDLEARGGAEWRHAVWGVPGGAAMANLLTFSALGGQRLRWFSQVDPGTPGLHPRYRWSARAVHWVSVLAGRPLPRPEYVPLDDPQPIARWMAQVLRGGRTPHLYTYASAAIRICRAALEASVDLHGAQFTVTGEPITAARLSMIHQAGAHGVPRYGSVESGPIGYGCLGPERSDEVHLFNDLYALVQPGPDGEPGPLPAGATLISALRPTTPFVMLNVSMGDQAVVVRRSCGCPLEQLGWATHLHTIRSFEKLTTGGMTFLDSDVVRILEEVLPARFGGGPTDYQLVEDEEAGQPGLRLLVHPKIGPLDDAAVADAFLAAVGHGSGAERVMELNWRRASLLRVERRPPLPTASGKIQHCTRRAPRLTQNPEHRRRALKNQSRDREGVGHLGAKPSRCSVAAIPGVTAGLRSEDAHFSEEVQL